MHTCSAFAGKCVAAAVAKIWMNVTVCRCMNGCRFLWMNAFVMKGVWEPLQAGVVVCRCLVGWKHPPISVFTTVYRLCWVGGREKHWVFSQHLPVAAAPVAAHTIGACLALPEPPERKEAERRGKPCGPSVTSWRLLQTPETVLG